MVVYTTYADWNFFRYIEYHGIGMVVFGFVLYLFF